MSLSTTAKLSISMSAVTRIALDCTAGRMKLTKTLQRSHTGVFMGISCNTSVAFKLRLLSHKIQ